MRPYKHPTFRLPEKRERGKNGAFGKMRSSLSKTYLLGLPLLVILQVAVFRNYTTEFFTPDGIFYLARPLKSWQDFEDLLVRLDDRDNYRPLTYVVATAVYRVAGLEPFPYHLFGLLFHIVISLLVFWLAAVILKSEPAALAVAFFFALHGAASHVVFGLTFLPDLCYALFFVLGLIAFFKFEGSGREGWYWASLLFFFLSLLSKEPAVTFPAVAILALVLVPGLSGRAGDGVLSWRQALRKTLPFWILAGLYLAWFGALSQGRFVPTAPDHPYRFSLTLDALLSKQRYLEWALNFRPQYGTIEEHPTIRALGERILPQGAAQIFLQTSDLSLYLLGPVWMLWLILQGKWTYVRIFGLNALWTPVMALVVALLIFNFYQSAKSRNKTTLYGLLFYAILLTPVLFLPRNKTMHHNLYMPAIGIGIVVGDFVSRYSSAPVTRRRRLALWLVPTVLTMGGIIASRANQKGAWPVRSAWTARTYLEDLRRLFPTLSSGTVLYFEKTGNREWPWLTDAGNMFRLFYNDPGLVTLFGDYGHDPRTVAPDRNLIRLRQAGGHLALVEERAAGRQSIWIDLLDPVSHRFVFQQKVIEDGSRYYVRAGELVFKTALEPVSYTVVLPKGFYLTFCSPPSLISEEVDGRISVRTTGSHDTSELLLRGRYPEP